jgi:hypothetical protein
MSIICISFTFFIILLLAHYILKDDENIRKMKKYEKFYGDLEGFDSNS